MGLIGIDLHTDSFFAVRTRSTNPGEIKTEKKYELHGRSLTFPRFRGHPIMLPWLRSPGVSMYHPALEDATTALLVRSFARRTPTGRFSSLSASNPPHIRPA